MTKPSLLIAALFALSALPAQANEACRQWDKVEDTAEKGAGWIERNWEKVEDAVIPETEEEKREEAAERRADRAEEVAEEKCKQEG